MKSHLIEQTEINSVQLLRLISKNNCMLDIFWVQFPLDIFGMFHEHYG